MRKNVFRALAVVSLVLIGLIAAEVVTAGYTWFTMSRVPWFAVSAKQQEPPSDQNLRLHPYYGYMARPRLSLSEVTKADSMRRQFGQAYMESRYAQETANSHGFLDPREFPYNDPNAFIIGVFGGSVAAQFAMTMEPVMRELLADHPRVRDRKLVLLSFANGGQKQPQQLTALAYFLSIGQRFDLILNLDGFNEAFIGWYNANKHNADELMPFARFIIGVQNTMLESRGISDGDDRLAMARQKLALALRDLSEPQFAMLFVLRRAAVTRIENELTQLEAKLASADAKTTYAMPVRPRTTPDASASRQATVSNWFNASIAMAGLSRIYRIPYLHVLQPNQYQTKAAFTDEQRKETLNLKEPPLTQLVPEYYSAFLARAQEFDEYGVEFLDATPVFDHSDGSVFHDNCCHFNEAGNRMLAGLIADKVKEKLK